MADRDPSSHRKPNQIPGGRHRVLCVDDDPCILSALTRFLEKEGYSVVRASSGKKGLEAFEAARSEKRPVNAVITDLIMPDLRGDQMAKTIKQEAPAVSVLLLSGSSSIAPGGNLPEGIDFFLHKPVHLKEIRRILRQALGQDRGKHFLTAA